jgi:hypothetical protein
MSGLRINGGLLRTNRKFVISISIQNNKVVDCDVISHLKEYDVHCDNVSRHKLLDIDRDNVPQHKFVMVSRASMRVLKIAKSDY